MSEFDLLGDAPFAEAARAAERLVGLKMYEPAIMSFRSFIELLAKELGRRHRLIIPANLKGLEELLTYHRILNQENAELFKDLRFAGNRATHDWKGNERLAKANLEKARSIARWFYSQYIQPESDRYRAEAAAEPARQRREQEEAARHAEQQRVAEQRAQQQRLAEEAARRAAPSKAHYDPQNDSAQRHTSPDIAVIRRVPRQPKGIPLAILGVTARKCVLCTPDLNGSGTWIRVGAEEPAPCRGWSCRP